MGPRSAVAASGSSRECPRAQRRGSRSVTDLFTRKPADRLGATRTGREAAARGARLRRQARRRRRLFDALVDARQTYGAKKPILEDQERNPLTYTDLIRACLRARPQDRGLHRARRAGRRACCRPASAAVVTFFALHAFGRVPTMLNFTAGIRNLQAACELAGVKRVLTSHRFVEQGKLHDLIDALETADHGHLPGGRARHHRPAGQALRRGRRRLARSSSARRRSPATRA